MHSDAVEVKPVQERGQEVGLGVDDWDPRPRGRVHVARSGDEHRGEGVLRQEPRHGEVSCRVDAAGTAVEYQHRGTDAHDGVLDPSEAPWWVSGRSTPRAAYGTSSSSSRTVSLLVAQRSGYDVRARTSPASSGGPAGAAASGWRRLPLDEALLHLGDHLPHHRVHLAGPSRWAGPAWPGGRRGPARGRRSRGPPGRHESAIACLVISARSASALTVVPVASRYWNTAPCAARTSAYPRSTRRATTRPLSATNASRAAQPGSWRRPASSPAEIGLDKRQASCLYWRHGQVTCRSQHAERGMPGN